MGRACTDTGILMRCCARPMSLPAPMVVGNAGMTGSGLTAGWRARMRPRCPVLGAHVGRQGAGYRAEDGFLRFRSLQTLWPSFLWPLGIVARGAWGTVAPGMSGRSAHPDCPGAIVHDLPKSSPHGKPL